MRYSRLYILEEVKGLAGPSEIFKSFNAKSVLRRRRKLLSGLPQREFDFARGLPFHQGRSDEKLREWLRDEPPVFSYQVRILENICSRKTCGDFVDIVKLTPETIVRELELAG